MLKFCKCIVVCENTTLSARMSRMQAFSERRTGNPFHEFLTVWFYHNHNHEGIATGVKGK